MQMLETSVSGHGEQHGLWQNSLTDPLARNPLAHQLTTHALQAQIQHQGAPGLHHDRRLLWGHR